MKFRSYVPVFALTLVLSAFLLFAVQPLFSKMILPLLGGSPQVWNTAMVFFQLALLGGYAYAHVTSRYLSVRVQAVLHVLLLLACSFLLPVAIGKEWVPPASGNPSFWQISLMAATVGGPFFVLAASAPMFQRWFTVTGHKDAHDPYFLYGASNLGSIAALLTYPVLIEPFLTLSAQAALWQYGYWGLIILAWACFLSVARAEKSTQTPSPRTTSDAPPTWKQRGLWLALSAIPSSLMLGLTTFLTTDIAPVPLLWVIPLALYVITFILAFARKPAMKLETILLIQGVLMVGMLGQTVAFSNESLLLLFTHLALFFFTALACHSELAAMRPAAGRLTEFYMILSLGGALGGIFNALFAPQFLPLPVEYPIALAAACFLRYTSGRSLPAKTRYVMMALAFNIALLVIAFLTHSNLVQKLSMIGFSTGLLLLLDRRWPFAIGMMVALAFFPPGNNWKKASSRQTLYQSRNFFGVIKIVDTKEGQRALLHGTTNHGVQSLNEKERLERISYYSRFSPLSDLFGILNTQRGAQNIAVLGLGVGTIACFSQKDRHFDFFEIDPDIIAIARNPEYFTFLSDCGSPYDIITGDARLKIAEQPAEKYDMIVADAFSSDNIPAHLLTLEAVDLYMTKVKENGLLVFHISNRYLDLEPLLGRVAEKRGLYALGKLTNAGKLPGSETKYYAAHYLVITKDKKIVERLEREKWLPAIERKGVEAWTDQYTNIISVLINRSLRQRFKATQQPTVQEP